MSRDTDEDDRPAAGACRAHGPDVSFPAPGISIALARLAPLVAYATRRLCAPSIIGE
jgi:hypothetical protein